MEEDEVLEDYEKFLQATAIRAVEKALEKLPFEDDDVESFASGSFATSSVKVCFFKGISFKHLIFLKG